MAWSCTAVDGVQQSAPEGLGILSAYSARGSDGATPMSYALTLQACSTVPCCSRSSSSDAEPVVPQQKQAAMPPSVLPGPRVCMLLSLACTCAASSALKRVAESPEQQMEDLEKLSSRAEDAGMLRGRGAIARSYAGVVESAARARYRRPLQNGVFQIAFTGQHASKCGQASSR